MRRHTILAGVFLLAWASPAVFAGDSSLFGWQRSSDQVSETPVAVQEAAATVAPADQAAPAEEADVATTAEPAAVPTSAVTGAASESSSAVAESVEPVKELIVLPAVQQSGEIPAEGGSVAESK
ncbi:MAG: hypothetical protein FD130_2009 [Halothiobacillaceae bacterium]|nr:MAG: hypothetical protein FD130_2009 [Halothiobacillaceae bacterium]